MLEKEINKIYPIILILIGTLGNTFTFIIYVNSEFTKSSSGYYFAFSALIETLTLYCGLIKYLIYGYSEILIYDVNIYACKILTFLIYALVQIAAWILVLISFDRLIITFSSRFLAKYRKRRYQTILILIIVGLILVINSPVIYFFRLNKYINSTTRCEFINREYGFIINLYDFFLTIFIPVVIMIFCNSMIITKVYKSKNKVFDKKTSSRKIRHFRFTLIAKVVIFIISNLPISITVLTNSILYNSYNVYDEDINNLIYTFANMLCYANYSVNFFVHFLLNKYFKNKFYIFLKKTKNCLVFDKFL